MRLCIIGNSHLAALKLGWDALAEKPDLQPTFFGAPSDGMRHLRAEGGRLIPKRRDIAEHFARMSGREDIRLDDYDAFLLVGLNVSIKRILRFYKTHAWAGLKGISGKVLVPPGFARDFLTERYGDTLMGLMAGQLAGRRVLAVAEPFWAEWIRKGAPDTPDYGWEAAISAGDGPRIGAMFAATVDASLPAHAQFLPQPERTVAHGIMTASDFNKEASRLITGEGGGTDAAHMNADFGKALWPGVAEALAQPGAKERSAALGGK
jgi:hypothetical protein